MIMDEYLVETEYKKTKGKCRRADKGYDITRVILNGEAVSDPYECRKSCTDNILCAAYEYSDELLQKKCTTYKSDVQEYRGDYV
jgi:hypothetical protein